MQGSFDPSEYWANVVRGDLGLDNVGYFTLGRAWNEWAYRVRARSFLAALEASSITVRSSSVLEVGVGSGFYLKFWCALGADRVVGVDISPAAIEHARAQYPMFDFCLGDVADVELPAGPFDLITVIDVFYHIVQDDAFERALTRLTQRLSPGGVLLFTDRLDEGVLNDTRFPHVRCRPLSAYREVAGKIGADVTPLNVVMVTMANPTLTINPRPTAVLLQQLWRMISIPLHSFRRMPRVQNVLGLGLGALFFCIDVLLLKLWRNAPNLTFGMITVRQQT